MRIIRRLSMDCHCSMYMKKVSYLCHVLYVTYCNTIVHLDRIKSHDPWFPLVLAANTTHETHARCEDACMACCCDGNDTNCKHGMLTYTHYTSVPHLYSPQHSLKETQDSLDASQHTSSSCRDWLWLRLDRQGLRKLMSESPNSRCTFFMCCAAGQTGGHFGSLLCGGLQVQDNTVTGVITTS